MVHKEMSIRKVSTFTIPQFSRPEIGLGQPGHQNLEKKEKYMVQLDRIMSQICLAFKMTKCSILGYVYQSYSKYACMHLKMLLYFRVFYNSINTDAMVDKCSDIYKKRS